MIMYMPVFYHLFVILGMVKEIQNASVDLSRQEHLSPRADDGVDIRNTTVSLANKDGQYNHTNKMVSCEFGRYWDNRTSSCSSCWEDLCKPTAKNTMILCKEICPDTYHNKSLYLTTPAQVSTTTTESYPLVQYSEVLIFSIIAVSLLLLVASAVTFSLHIMKLKKPTRNKLSDTKTSTYQKASQDDVYNQPSPVLDEKPTHNVQKKQSQTAHDSTTENKTEPATTLSRHSNHANRTESPAHRQSEHYMPKSGLTSHRYMYEVTDTGTPASRVFSLVSAGHQMDMSLHKPLTKMKKHRSKTSVQQSRADAVLTSSQPRTNYSFSPEQTHVKQTSDDPHSFVVQGMVNSESNEFGDAGGISAENSLDLLALSITDRSPTPSPHSAVQNSLPEEDQDVMWKEILDLYTQVEAQLYLFRWIVGCMISNDVLEVVVDIRNESFGLWEAQDKLCQRVPSHLHKYLELTEEGPSLDLC